MMIYLHIFIIKLSFRDYTISKCLIFLFGKLMAYTAEVMNTKEKMLFKNVFQ